MTDAERATHARICAEITGQIRSLTSDYVRPLYALRSRLSSALLAANRAGLTYDELAVIVGWHRSTVAAEIKRARAELADE